MAYFNVMGATAWRCEFCQKVFPSYAGCRMHELQDHGAPTRHVSPIVKEMIARESKMSYELRDSKGRHAPIRERVVRKKRK